MASFTSWTNYWISLICGIAFHADTATMSALFHPRWVVWVHLRQVEDVLKSPAIWSCNACRRYTEACGAPVKVHEVVQHLQDLAGEQGIIHSNLRCRLEEAEKRIYSRYIQEIDTIFSHEP
jgi:heterodisulfide reductase subunit C